MIGTVIHDYIQPFYGDAITSFGGIYYTVMYLATMGDARWNIIPVARVGEDIYDSVLRRLGEYKCVITSHLLREATENTKVRLLYRTPVDREEKSTKPMAPLAWPDVAVLSNCDYILVNFITGTEMELRTFQKLAAECDGCIYEDYHSLALGLDAAGVRYPRRDPEWRQWTSTATIVQMNELEAATLLGRTVLELPLDEHEIADAFLHGNTQLCIITLGDKGAYLCRKEGGEVTVDLVPPYPIDKFVDPTGCGDAFAAGFLKEFARSQDILASAGYANFIAGLNCTISGTEEIITLREKIMGKRQ